MFYVKILWFIFSISSIFLISLRTIPFITLISFHHDVKYKTSSPNTQDIASLFLIFTAKFIEHTHSFVCGSNFMIKKKWFMQIKYEFLVITLSFCFPLLRIVYMHLKPLSFVRDVRFLQRRWNSRFCCKFTHYFVYFFCFVVTLYCNNLGLVRRRKKIIIIKFL